jgi:hypothetical protein
MNGRECGPCEPFRSSCSRCRWETRWEPELGALFDKRFGKKCAFVVGPVIGFDSRDRILFEAGDYYEEGDDDPGP